MLDSNKLDYDRLSVLTGVLLLALAVDKFTKFIHAMIKIRTAIQEKR